MVDIRVFSDSIANIVERVIDSVVTISTARITFDLFSFGFRELRGIGSGFVITRDGYIITNYHVVKDARTVDIYFRDGLSMRGDVVATDPYRDLALLKIDMNTKPVSLGDSDSIRIGEIVLAIGSPFGLMGPTVTMGVVSAVGRTIIGENIILEDLIQTDAAINPGNSGGPLINTEGKAIAVATAIIPYAQGIGFAIPINSVKRFIDMLNKYGRPV
ncbi:MAG: trypsin-like peptidase domain-containing protein, partial [Desulfurococcaceae archaeon]